MGIFDTMSGWIGARKSVPEWDQPFKTCLFPPGVCTWQAFARGTTDAQRKTLVDGLHNLGSNAIIFLTSNADGPVSLYQSGWTGALDSAQCDLLRDTCKRWVFDEGLCLFPTLFCDEDNQPLRKNTGEHDRYFATVCELIDDLGPNYLLGLESSEYWDSNKLAAEYALMRRHTSRPIGTHAQWNGGRLPVDFLAYEHPWHPGDGDARSAAECVARLKAAQAAGGYPIFASEYNTNVGGARYAEQRAAMAAVEGVMGVG